MNMSALRLLALVVSVITTSTFYTHSSAKSLSEGINNIFSRLGGTEQPEFLDPDDAFIASVDVVSSERINVHWQIAEGYYLYKDKFNFSISDDNIAITDIKLPEGKLKNDPDFGSVQVNYDEVDAHLTVQKSDESLLDAELRVKYQGCKEDVLCYPPISKTFPIKFISNVDAATVESSSIEPGTRQLSEQDAITEHLSDDGFLINIIIFFGFGLLLALTPCVFPMIPILSGIIVGEGISITPLRAFYMSLTYVLAMAFTYAVLGIIAGSLDVNLQAASQNVWVITTFSAVFVLLSLSMFGFYELQLPASLQSKLSGATDRHNHTLYGVAIMGVLSAIIVGPCIAPPLAGALLYISQTGDAVLGGFALFAMGLGMGVPLLVIGVSAGKLLPRAGAWMESIKHVFGVLMLGVAIWFMERVLPGPLTLMLWALLFIISAIYMGALDRSARQSKWQGLWRGVGLAMLVYGIILIIGAASGGSNIFKPLQSLSTNNQTGEIRSSSLSFQSVKGADGLQTALEKAANEGKFVMLDFYADWCITCKEMEHNTFIDQGVQTRLSDFILLKADVTENDVMDKALLKKFNLYGPPAILFFNKKGTEKKSHRVVGFMNAADFTTHINEVIGK